MSCCGLRFWRMLNVLTRVSKMNTLVKLYFGILIFSRMRHRSNECLYTTTTGDINVLDSSFGTDTCTVVVSTAVLAHVINQLAFH
jgi:hypothetical protein